MCTALREASRAVSCLYDDELRRAGLRTTQYSQLSRISRVGDVRQRDLARMTSLGETTLTRNLRRLSDAGWVDTTAGKDEREKLVRLTKDGIAKLRQARPAWEAIEDSKTRTALRPHRPSPRRVYPPAALPERDCESFLNDSSSIARCVNTAPFYA
jgi:DNA-binding MarR family transcriptional regulator